MSNKKSATRKKKTVQVQAEPLMYVGPTIRGVAIQNRVYTEVPQTAKEAMTACPLLSNLFVSVKRYPDAERQIGAKKGSLYVAFDAALSYKNKHN